MDKAIMKYNPAFLKSEEIINLFAVRYNELKTIINITRENVTQSNQHILVIGPRGIGKTILLLRAVEEIKRDKDLSTKWYPLVFSEESYNVSTCGEFWLESLLHLAHQTKDDRWQKTYKELLDEKDDVRLRERALAQLMDFADSQNKRILLVVENLNMLLGDQMNDAEAWALRHTLLHEHRIMLLTSATSRFEQIEAEDKPMFDLFRFVELKPLVEKECSDLWYSLTNQRLNEQRIRPLKILTGGNPRLLTIVSNFAARMSVKELMDDLLHLIDENTEYFKSHLESLPPVERKVYTTLAEIWDPATARQVAKTARLEVSPTSALLGRLINRGAVVETDGSGRTKFYQVAERMYNIYYLMRRQTEASWRIKALVPFMVSFYEPTELVGLARQIAEEACMTEPAYRQEHYLFYENILCNIDNPICRQEIIRSTRHDFFEMPDAPHTTQKIIKSEVEALIKKGLKLEKKGRFVKAKNIYDEAINLRPTFAKSYLLRGILLSDHLKQYDEAEKDFLKLTEIQPESDFAWAFLGEILSFKLNKPEEGERALRQSIAINSHEHWPWELLGLVLQNVKKYDDAEQAYRKAIDLDPNCSNSWGELGQLLGKEFGQYEEAEKSLRKAIEIDPKVDWWHYQLGRVFLKIEKYKEAESAFRKAIDLEPKNVLAWSYLGQVLYRKLGQLDESEKAYRKAVEIDPDYPCPWFYLGQLLQKQGNYTEAEKAYRTSIEKGSDCDYVWENILRFLLENLGRSAVALKLAEEYLSKHPKDTPKLNEFAWTFYKYGPSDLLTKAEIWAEEGIKLEPDNTKLQHTLSSILCALGKKDKALEYTDKYLNDTELVKESIDDTINLFVDFAARGYAKEALDVLKKSSSSKVLEPLVVGLRLYIGEDVKAAAEIMEVAKDVVKRIEQQKNKTKKDSKK